MSENDNAQSESQIARYMLVVQSSNLYYDQYYFEISVQQTIRRPDSTIVFWYKGYAILGFETIADYEATEEDLQDHEVCGCVVSISRQEKFALEVIQAAALTAAIASASAASASAASVSAPTAAVRTTPAPAPAPAPALAPAPVQAGPAAFTEIEDDGTGWATHPLEEDYAAEYGSELPEVEYDSD
ncbi:hypothetical protein Trisim1_004350 [Trichoderma cf. simile WF8]